jgi:hypothetical protein
MDIIKHTGSFTGGSFEPSQLGLDLDLRTPNSAFASFEEAHANTMLSFRAQPSFGGVDDITCILDQSQGLALSTNYKNSDYSVGVDGAVISSGLTSLDGGINGIGGYDGVLRATCDTSTGAHYCDLIPSNFYRQVVKLEFQVYIDEGSTNIDSIGLAMAGGTAAFYWSNLAKGEWHTLTWVGYNNFSNNYRIFATSGGNWNFTSAADDIYYIASGARIDKIDGNHFIQNTASKCPHWDNTNFTVDFDGVDDELEDLGGNFFTAVSSDTTGTWVTVNDDDEGSGQVLNPINFSDATGTHVIEIGRIETTDKSGFRNLTSLVDTTLIYTNTPIRDGRNTQMLSCDGTSDGTLMYLNEVSDAKSSGTDNGYWHNYNAVVNSNVVDVRIGSRYGLSYWSFGFRGAQYRTTELTTGERTKLKIWLDANV